jgi:hypothetical protein
MEGDSVESRVDELIGGSVASALAKVEAAQEELYYDEAADQPPARASTRD